MAIGVTVNYTIEDIDSHDPRVEIKYLLSNTDAPLSRRYLEVYDLSSMYSGLGNTDVTADRESLVRTNFLSLTASTMTAFADEARNIILSSIGTSVGIGLTGAASFSFVQLTYNGEDKLKAFTWLDNKTGM
jgi:hypothetical protein